MMFCAKLFVLITVFFSFYSCAKRNYVDSISTSLLSAENGEITCTYFYKKENLCLDIKWENEPSDGSFSSLIMTFFKKDAPEVGIDPHFTPLTYLWMPSMGHGSAPVSMEKIDTGIYRASRIYFSMPGEWLVRYQLLEGKKVIEEYAQTVRI